MNADLKASRNRSVLKLAAAAALMLFVLIVIPAFVEVYQMQLLIYGLIAAIAALGRTRTTVRRSSIAPTRKSPRKSLKATSRR